MKREKTNLSHEAYAKALSSKGCWQKGQLVRSQAGRDNGRYYLVLAEEGEFLWVADGRKRPVSLAKRKNKRHLQKIKKVAADLSFLEADKTPTDEMVRAAIASLMKSEKKVGRRNVQTRCD